MVVSIVEIKSLIFVVKSPVVVSISMTSMSFLWNSSLHLSCKATSPALSASMSEIMPVISASTFLNASRRTLADNCTSALRPDFVPVFSKTRLACSRLRSSRLNVRRVDESWRNANVPAIRSLASSSVKILIVSPTAAISNARVFERSSHSLSDTEQRSFKSTKNAWSASIAPVVSSRSSFASANATLVFPKSAVFSLIIFSPAAISQVLLRLRQRNLGLPQKRGLFLDHLLTGCDLRGLRVLQLAELCHGLRLLALHVGQIRLELSLHLRGL